jgi:hypothetical protein
LGFIGYYKHFIFNYAQITTSLTNLTKLHTLTMHWKDNAAHSLNTFKTAMQTAPVLNIPDLSRPFTVYTDASDIAIGAVLVQQSAPEDPTTTHPICFLSRNHPPTVKRYPLWEKELYSLIHAL